MIGPTPGIITASYFFLPSQAKIKQTISILKILQNERYTGKY